MSTVNVSNSATRYGAVTPSDSTELRFKRLYVGGTGNVVLKSSVDGAAITFWAVPAGTQLEVSGVRVMAATTATTITWMDW